MLGQLWGLALATSLVTFGSLIGIFIAQYQTVALFWFIGSDINTCLPPSPMANLVKQLVRETIAGEAGEAQEDRTQEGIQDQKSLKKTESQATGSMLRGTLNQMVTTAQEYKRDLDDLMTSLATRAQDNAHLYTILQLFARLLPILPGWFVSTICAVFPVSWPRFAFIVALSTLPYTYLTVRMGAVTLDTVDHVISDEHIKLSLTLMVLTILGVALKNAGLCSELNRGWQAVRSGSFLQMQRSNTDQ